MAGRLMKSVSGIRGVVGETMNPDLILRIGAAFAKYCKKGRIVIGRDSRITGDAIAGMVESVFALSGCEVIDVGIVPTPTVQIMVEELKADGGVVISASHNPIEWNAFKLINSSGTFLNSIEMNKFFNLMDSEFIYEKWNRIGRIIKNTNANDIHISRAVGAVDIEKIKRCNFRIALDSVNGAGSKITQDLLKALGCRVFPINCEITGTFPRGAEPLAENLSALSDTVKKGSVDIGFAQDPDADRLAIVDEHGKPVGEEITIALVVEHLLSREPGRVVINLSTTKTVEDIAVKYNSPVVRTKVGEINVVDEMRRRGARIGGEGNGGVISPEVHLGRDSLVGIAYILEMMAERGKTISGLVDDLPRYSMKKGKVKIGKTNVATSIKKIKTQFKQEKISELDGLRIDFIRKGQFQGGWVHLRSSNTEPIFRVISEGRDEKQAKMIYSHFAKFFR